MNNQNQTSPKAKQFAEELDELMKKYQYTLVAELDVKRTGLIPFIAIHETIPPKTITKPEDTGVRLIDQKPKEFEDMPKVKKAKKK